MIVRFARHGQPALSGMPKGGNYEFPPGDPVLTPLGREQAEFLGGYLRRSGFRGRVISSPYARAVETASIVAEACGLDIYLEPRIQEMRFYPDPSCPGLTLAELRRNYPNIAPDAVLGHPWITPGGAEGLSAVQARVDGFVAELLAAPPADDILLVAHGAPLHALKVNFLARAKFEGPEGYNWNCSLSSFRIDGDKTELLELCRYDFMPTECVTSNRRLFGDPECV